MSQKPAPNPFYSLLILTGVAFVLTASAFLVMMMRDVQGTAPRTALTDWLSLYGTKALVIELVILAIGTWGAMATDSRSPRPNPSVGTGADTADGKQP